MKKILTILILIHHTLFAELGIFEGDWNETVNLHEKAWQGSTGETEINILKKRIGDSIFTTGTVSTCMLCGTWIDIMTSTLYSKHATQRLNPASTSLITIVELQAQQIRAIIKETKNHKLENSIHSFSDLEGNSGEKKIGEFYRKGIILELQRQEKLLKNLQETLSLGKRK